MAERFLIEHYLPLWNIGMDGFGNHDPGSGRHAGEITWWDALHPGRPWAKKLSQTKTPASAQAHLKKLLENYETTPKVVSLEDIEPHEDD